MRWEDERYVRLYTRDTGDWLFLSFDAQALMMMLLRKVDRAGILHLGKHGKQAVPVTLGHTESHDRIMAALDVLLSDGCVQVDGEKLIIPNFIEAQEARISDAQRKRDQRERDRDVLLEKESSGKSGGLSAEAHVTTGHTRSHSVTRGHAVTRQVTPSLAVPSLAVPSRAEEEGPAAAAPPAPRVDKLAAAVNAEWPDLNASGEVVAAWKRAFPDVDLPMETRQARSHWLSNTESRKPGEQPPAFLNRWFKRATTGPPIFARTASPGTVRGPGMPVGGSRKVPTAEDFDRSEREYAESKLREVGK